VVRGFALHGLSEPGPWPVALVQSSSLGDMFIDRPFSAACSLELQHSFSKNRVLLGLLESQG
jgi:hypothetical protein